jgi:hypothetical protein
MPSWPLTHDSRHCRLINDRSRRRTFTIKQLERLGPVVGPGLCCFLNLRRNQLGTGIKSDNIISQVDIIIVQADCHVHERTLSSPVDTRVTLHVKAKTSPVICAILTLAAYLYFYGVSVGIGIVQLAFVHALIVFATFMFGYFGRK